MWDGAYFCGKLFEYHTFKLTAQAKVYTLWKQFSLPSGIFDLFPIENELGMCTVYNRPFPLSHVHTVIESLFVGGGEILLDQWYVHNEVILCFVLYLFSRDLSVCQERLFCSLCGVTLTTLFWHSSGVARFLSSIHAPVCRVDKASQVSLHQHRHLTVSRFTPHRRLLRSRVIGLLTQTMRVNKTQRCFGLWEMCFL